MKKTVWLITLFILCIVFLTGCSPSEAERTSTTSFEQTPTPFREGDIITVTSTSDSGTGSLRQALKTAQPYDTVNFDPTVFPPDAPATIFITSALPHIRVSNLTVDASNAGVILDGSQISGDWIAGLAIVDTEGCLIMGLQVSHFPGPGIGISGIAKYNVIGGDRGVGAGPWGQGNLLTNNVTGIDLTISRNKFNTITGNLVGTDLVGTDGLGNNRGVSIWEGANNNTIGPNNIIANNREGGVVISGHESHHNTITQNSIYENNENDIWLEGGSNEGLTLPIIYDFDISAGTVAGGSCANCKVEIFSSSSGGGEIFEGQITANELGSFAFDKGVSFSGPNLTATNTDIDGNTSEFLQPTSGTFRTLNLQLENDFPIVPVVHKPFDEMADNHVGVWFEAHDRYYDTNFVYSNGFKRMRIGSLAGEGQWWGTIMNEEALSAVVDETISEYADAGVEMVLILASGAGIPHADGIFQTEAEFEQYLAYVSFVVSHFQGRIDAYEIWNEPGHMLPETYATLVERTVPIIRSGDPDAKIIIGAIQCNMDEGYPGYGEYPRFTLHLDYLNSLLQAGVVDQVDGVSWHPYYDIVPSDPFYQDYPNVVQGIKDLAAANGFTGEYFADEIMWHAVDEPDWDNGPPVGYIVSAKYYLRTITEHRGLGMNVTIQTFFLVPFMEPTKNVNHILAGAEPTDIALSIETSEDANVRYYIFILPDGDKLVALWTNDEAVEDDPGVSATITMNNLSAQKAIGIDVFYGFEQELIFAMENGDLMIHDLLVKDYPIFIRITP